MELHVQYIYRHSTEAFLRLLIHKLKGEHDANVSGSGVELLLKISTVSISKSHVQDVNSVFSNSQLLVLHRAKPETVLLVNIPLANIHSTHIHFLCLLGGSLNYHLEHHTPHMTSSPNNCVPLAHVLWLHAWGYP